MKNLTINHLSVKHGILSGLINSADAENSRYNAVKAGLLNNATVFPVPEEFSAEKFSESLQDFFAAELGVKTVFERVGEDIFMTVFSAVGFGLMKRAAVFTVFDSHLYINILPFDEIENSNYIENKLSGLITAGKYEKIYSFTEEFIMGFYPEEIRLAVKPSGRYFTGGGCGLSAILASHLETGEYILARLDIYKVEQSKSNAQTSEDGRAFYVLTTSGSCLFVLDKNLQEKYIETVSSEEMKVYPKIGRDSVAVGGTKWITERDNDFLFDEIQHLNNKNKEEKLYGVSVECFNRDEDGSGKERSAFFMEVLSRLTASAFDCFAAAVIKFCASLSGEKSDEENIKTLIVRAEALFSDAGSLERLKKFMSDFELSKDGILSLVYAVCRVSGEIQDKQCFNDVLLLLKDKYFKAEASDLNRAFVSVLTAEKLCAAGGVSSAQKLSDYALDKLSQKNFPGVSPSGDTLYGAALRQAFKISQTDKDRLKYAKLCVDDKPLVKSNLERLSELADEDLKKRVNIVLTLFNPENFNNFPPSDARCGCSAAFSSFSMRDFSKAVQRGGVYSDLKSWLQKATPDSTVSALLDYAVLTDDGSFPELNALFEECKAFFEMPDVKLYVIKNRSQGVLSNDDGEKKYIIIDDEMLDEENAAYMNTSQMAFLLAKELANLKFGFSRLFCRPQFRNFSVAGKTCIDVVSQFAPQPRFLSEDYKSYTKVLKFSELLTKNPSYFDFSDADSEHLKKTLETLNYEGVGKSADLKIREYGTAAWVAHVVSDRAALLFTGDFVSSVKAAVKNDKYIKNGAELLKSESVLSLAVNLESDNMLPNTDFFLRLSALSSYYLSDDYVENVKILQKKCKKILRE